MEYSQEGVTNVLGVGAGRNWPVTRPLKDRAWLEASFWPHFQEFGGRAWVHEEGGTTCRALCPRSIPPLPAIVSPRSEPKLPRMRALRLGAAQASRHSARTRPRATGLPGTDVLASFRASVSPAESGPPAPTVPDVSGGDDRCDRVDLCHQTALRFRRLSAPPRKHASLPPSHLSPAPKSVSMCRQKRLPSPHPRHQVCRNAVHSEAINPINKRWFTAFNREAAFITVSTRAGERFLNPAEGALATARTPDAGQSKFAPESAAPHVHRRPRCLPGSPRRGSARGRSWAAARTCVPSPFRGRQRPTADWERLFSARSQPGTGQITLMMC